MNRLFYLIFLLGAGQATAQSIVWITACADKTFCFNPGSCSEGNVYMVEKAVTNCPNQVINYSYRIDLYNNGGIEINSSEDTITGPFPVGTHKVTWRATDFCGNLAQCTYLFTIKDCAGPSLICINGLTQNLDPPICSETFYANQFILNYSDNCTPTNEIDIGIKLASAGGGFPDSTSISFDSCDVGIQFVTIVVRDGGGLTNTCQCYVLVQNGNNSCTCNIDSDLNFKGCARTAGNLKMAQYNPKINLQRLDSIGVWNKQSIVSDSCFNIPVAGIPFGGDYQATVKATRNDSPVNGFSTFDLVLISKHILGLEPFTSFYQVMAADMNNSHTVTTFDIVEGRKLLLGIYDTLPAVPAWRLIQPLANPANLSQWDMVKDTYQIKFINLLADLNISNLNFIGVKTGDINLSASFSAQPDDRTAQPLLLWFSDRFVEQGETITLPISKSGADLLSGWQLALVADTSLFEIEGIEGLSEEAYHLGSGGTVRFSWFDPKAVLFPNGSEFFTLRLKINRSCRLSEGLRIDPDILVPEGYDGNGRRLPVLLRAYSGEAFGTSGRIRCFPPQPNPFNVATNLGIWTDREEIAVVQVFEPGGRLVHEAEYALIPGFQSIMLQAHDLPSGWLTYRIRTATEVFAGKLLKAP